MLSATDIPSAAERRAALDGLEWVENARQLAGRTNGLLRNQAVDLIDVAVGTEHARAALVSLQEGAQLLLQTAIDLVEAHLVAALLTRTTELCDPLGTGGPLATGEDPDRVRRRGKRMGVEMAAIRLASAGNDLVNAHVRLAWEANCAGLGEVKLAGFNPESEQPRNWTGPRQLKSALDELAGHPMSILPQFVLTAPFERWTQTAEVEAVREMRDRLIHRGPPSYADAPSHGRFSLWRQGRFSLTFPTPEESRGDEASTDQVACEVSNAASATLDYACAIWDVTLRWLASVDVDVNVEPGTVTVGTNLILAQVGPKHPREQRDPGPFLAATA